MCSVAWNLPTYFNLGFNFIEFIKLINFQAVLNPIYLTLVIFFHETMVILSYLLFLVKIRLLNFIFRSLRQFEKWKSCDERFFSIFSCRFKAMIQEFMWFLLRVFLRSAFCFLTPRDSKCWVRFLKNFTSAIIVGKFLCCQ